MSYSHQQLEPIFSAALERSDADEQRRYLDEACGEDLTLRERIEALLRNHDEEDDFLEKPAVTWVPLDDEPWEITPQVWGAVAMADAAVQAAGLNVDGDTMATFPTEKVPRVFPPLDPPAQPGSQGRLGSYEILKTLAAGGMGIVLQAHDTDLQRPVAIKVLGPLLVNDPNARQRFFREAQAAAAVSHPHVVSIHTVQQVDGLPYLVMEYVEGGTLQSKLQREGRLGLRDIVRIGLQTALGLAAAHQRGLIHRDIKPGNILLEDGEQVKITDFGLAHAADDVPLTQTGVVAGTPQFMSPEQAEGLPLGPRSDLFSFGVVLYAMCTGRSPFAASSVPAVLRAVCDTPARALDEVNPEIPTWLAQLIARLLAKDPEERYPSAVDVAEELKTQWLLLREEDRSTTAVRCTGHCGSCQWGLMRQPDLSPAPSVAAMLSTDRPAAAELDTIGTPARTAKSPRRRWLIAASLPLAAAFLLWAGVILLRTADGTYILQTDDPQIAAQLGTGGGIVVVDQRTDRTYTLRRGANRLPSGDYELRVSTPEGLELDTPQFRLKRGDRVTATVRAVGTSVSILPAMEERDHHRIAALPASEQVRWVVEELQRLNPGFDGKLVTTTEEGRVVRLDLATEFVSDISPLQALSGLKSLSCRGGPGRPGMLVDLSPLKDLKLSTLILDDNPISDLSPLQAMPLKRLEIYRTRVVDISVLTGMPLENLHLSYSRVTDLTPLRDLPLDKLFIEGLPITDVSPLKGMPLKKLGMYGVQVRDLSPLKGMPLEYLNIQDSRVTDLSPISGAPLRFLCISRTQISDLSPLKGIALGELLYERIPARDVSVLKGMPLKTVWCPDFLPDRDIAVWRAIPTLQIINGVGAQEFWKKYDATRGAQTGALQWPAGARQPAIAAFDETQPVQLPFNQHDAQPTRPTRSVDGLEMACSETELLSRNPRRCRPLRQSICTSVAEQATRPERPGANL